MFILDLIRGLVFGVFLICCVVAFGSWAVMTRRIDPFSKTGRAIRRFSDPILRPLEFWVRRRGGNPQKAGWWLLGGSVVGGILIITLSEWIIAQTLRLTMASHSGPRDVLRLIVYYAGQLMIIALIARVIGSWFRIGRFNRWMRPVYVLTDWIVEPLRKIVPPIGMIDITPLVAWLLLQIVLSIVLGLI